jgi:hypothetical protein
LFCTIEQIGRECQTLEGTLALNGVFREMMQLN